MSRPLRPVKFQIIIAILTRRSVALRMGAVFLIVGGIGTALITFMPSFDDGVPDVDYAQISAKGETATGTITSIVKSDVLIDDEHPYIISYRYSTKGGASESKFRTLDLQKVGHMNVGDAVQVKYLNGESIITSLSPVGFSMLLVILFPLVFVLVCISCLVYVFIFAFVFISSGSWQKQKPVSSPARQAEQSPRTTLVEVEN